VLHLVPHGSGGGVTASVVIQRFFAPNAATPPCDVLCVVCAVCTVFAVCTTVCAAFGVSRGGCTVGDEAPCTHA
jgi:hypothetical protein